MFFCTVYACIYVVILFENVVVNVSDRFERCWDSDVLLSHAENFPQTSFSLMFPLVLVQVVENCYIMLLLYSEHLQNAFLSDVFPLELPSMPRVREDLRTHQRVTVGSFFNAPTESWRISLAELT